MDKGSLFSTPSPTFVICILLDDTHSDRCEMTILIQSWTVFENIYRGYFRYKWENLNMDQIIENINVLLNSSGWDNAIVVLLDNVFATYVQKVQEKNVCVCVCVGVCL